MAAMFLPKFIVVHNGQPHFGSSTFI